MAEADPLAPVLNLTPEEKRVFGQLFRKADPDNVGVVTGDVAVSFFEQTRLDSRILGEIWQIADKENRGFLTPPGFGVVLRLIGHAQAGRELSPELALQPGPLPRFDAYGSLAGVTPNLAPAGQVPGTIAPSPAPLQAQHTAAGGPFRIPPLTPDKVAQFGGLFESQPLQNGYLSGDQARQIFEKSGLPNEILGRIWQLADTEQRGSLTSTEFIIAMHLLSAMKTGTIRSLPAQLPAALFEAASRRGPIAACQSPVPTGVGIAPMGPQLTGQSPLRTTPTGGRPGTATLQAQNTGFGGAPLANDWLVTPAEKQRFDQFYDDLDKSRRGFITGEEAVPFFSQSGLSEEVLAQVWDLSDITATGSLTRDEFAVAMYLIRQQRSGRGGPMPTILPPRLIPPFMRGVARPTSSASPFDAPPMGSPVPAPTTMPAPAPALAPAHPAPKSALDDLFGLDAPSSPPPAKREAPAILAPTDHFSDTPRTTSPLFKPFIPSSSFGQGLASNNKPAAPAGGDDLLGGDDPNAANISNESTELANISNHISSLSTQMQTTQTQQKTVQNDLNQTNSQKQNFEQRLAQLRSVYEKEAQNLRGLEEQLRISRAETAKLQSECMALDGNFQDLNNQKNQVAAALQADQQENAALKQKISALNTEIAQLKPQIEKLRRDARQQQGLVAINKKQLATNEGEKEKLRKESEELTKSINESKTSLVDRTASPAISTSVTYTQSPASSTAGNNPFFNRSVSTDIGNAFSSPTPAASTNFDNTNFDDIFGSAPPAASPGNVVSSPLQGPAATAQATGNSIVSGGSFPTPPDKAESPAPVPGRFPITEPADISKSMTPRQISPALSRSGGDDTHSIASGAAPAIANAFPGFTVASTSKPNSPAPATSPFARPDSTNSPASTLAFPPPAVPPTADHFTALGSADDTEDKAKADFESAFASFKKTHKSTDSAVAADTTKAFASSNSEFPPLQEFDGSDSDSDSDNGFDDDFSPTQAVPAAEGKAPPDAGNTDPFGVSPFEVSASTITTPTPTITAPAPAPAVTPKPKASFDDDFDDFDGLEDAKEGTADDEFASISRSGIDEFSQPFDSSPPHSQAKSDSASTAFGAGSGAGSFDFISGGSATASSTAVGTSGGHMTQGADWEAIFAGASSAAGTSAPAGEAVAVPPTTNSTFIAASPASAPTSEKESTGNPALSNLLNLGFDRQASERALERYDNNVERAADFLFANNSS